MNIPILFNEEPTRCEIMFYLNNYEFERNLLFEVL